MKYLTLFLLLVTLASPAVAQTALDDQIALARQSAQTDRKVILLANMNFTSEESELFWPKWEEYRAAAVANGDRKLALIKEFAENYENMNNQVADEVMTDYFSIKMQEIVILQSFAKELTHFMPATKAMRVIQIETKLDAAITMQLASEIPLAK